METDVIYGPQFHQYMIYGIFGSLALGVLIFLYYEMRVLTQKDFKEKYDYVNLNEIKFFWYTVIFFLIAGAFAVNTVGDSVIEENGIRWFFVRIFISMCFIAIGYYVFYSIIRIYYPKKLSKRLHRLRTTPRISPDGNAMRRLSEDEEDVHMEQSMIAEEGIQAVDYDVWIDEKTGYKKIEKYIIHDQTSECPECGYYTLAMSSEEVSKAPTVSESGIITEHLQCNFCGYKEKREVSVSALSSNVA